MPIGAFTASHKLMSSLQNHPKLGHITTFGGNPVIAAAALATLREVVTSDVMAQTHTKEQLIRDHLKHTLITEIRGKGLMLAIILKNANIANQLIIRSQEKGLILFWLLFEQKAVRITPPLTITNDELIKGCGIIVEVLNSIQSD